MSDSESTYQQVAILQGPQDAILSVAFSPDGLFVAAVGFSGITVWNLATNNPVAVPQIPYNPRIAKYTFSASSWLRFETNKQLFLLAGSFRGDILVWKWSPEDQEFRRFSQIPPQTQDEEILAIDVHQTQVPAGKRGRIVVSAADRSIRVFTFSVKGECQTVFTKILEEGFLPKTVRFHKSTGSIFVFARTGGGVMQLNRVSGVVLSHNNYGPDIMASVCLDPKDCFVACTGRDFGMYKLNTLELIRKFQGESPIVRFSKHAVFVEDGGLLVGGTDRGCAVVYETSSGNAVQTLEYPRGGLVQFVAGLSTNDRHLVAIAGSTLQQSADVIVFQKQCSKQLPTTSDSDSGPPAEDLGSNDAPHNPIFVGFRIQRISPRIFIRNSIMFILMFFGIYKLAQEHTPRLLQMGRMVILNVRAAIEEVDRVAET